MSPMGCRCRDMRCIIISKKRNNMNKIEIVRGILAHVFTSEQRRRQGLERPTRLEETAAHDHPVA
jgi:hypothetical protein